MLPSCTRAYNPGHSLFYASCLTKWRQNEGHSCGISFRRLFCSLERARATQRQFLPMWRRIGCLPQNTTRETCCIPGPPRSCACPIRALRIRVAADMLPWLLPRAHIPHIPISSHGTLHVYSCFIQKSPCSLMLTRQVPRALTRTLQLEVKGKFFLCYIQPRLYQHKCRIYRQLATAACTPSLATSARMKKNLRMS
jgi:hypothetical protein